AMAPRDISSGGDFYELASIDVNKDLHDPDRLKYLKLEIVGFDKGVSDWASLNEGRQRFRDGMIEIAREEMPTRVNYSLPYPGQSEELKAFLKPEFNIECDDNVIKAKVREISGDLKDPLEAARRLLEWVYRNVQKRPVVTVPSALEVLRSRVGDCNEHAVLLAALLRASGIPARVCVGLVCARGRFFYHAWNEAYLGSWVSMDATLNQMPVDASHIKLLHGGLDKQVEIIGLIGKLRLKVISYMYD
ncbi:MAG: transglutaminase-like domain-containing protein, partial [Pseudomonadota bacterium]